jgi:hypothetical protein
MKLHEEFKLYENMWKDEDTEVVGLKEASPTKDFFTWTVGSKTYNIVNNVELRAYIKAAVQDKLTNDIANYPEDDINSEWRATYDTFKELIAFYEMKTPKDSAFINRLNVLRHRTLGDLHKSYDQQALQQDVSALAETCVKQFIDKMKTLTTFFDYNINKSYCQNPIDTIKEELIDLGMSLAHPNYHIN